MLKYILVIVAILFLQKSFAQLDSNQIKLTKKDYDTVILCSREPIKMEHNFNLTNFEFNFTKTLEKSKGNLGISTIVSFYLHSRFASGFFVNIYSYSKDVKSYQFKTIQPNLNQAHIGWINEFYFNKSKRNLSFF